MPVSDEILEAFYILGKMFPRPFETKYAWAKRLKYLKWPQYERGVRHLKDRGLLKITKRTARGLLN